MTEIPEIVIKRVFEKLDRIDEMLIKQRSRITTIEADQNLIKEIWKKLAAVIGTVGGIISIVIALT